MLPKAVEPEAEDVSTSVGWSYRQSVLVPESSSAVVAVPEAATPAAPKVPAAVAVDDRVSEPVSVSVGVAVSLLVVVAVAVPPPSVVVAVAVAQALSGPANVVVPPADSEAPSALAAGGHDPRQGSRQRAVSLLLSGQII